MNNNDYVFVPKELMEKKYKNYSAESKLLLSVMINYAKKGSAIMETANLINKIGENQIINIKETMKQNVDKHIESE